MIDLDNLSTNNGEGGEPSVNSDDLSLATRKASIEDVYDRFTKLIYVVDVSASMGDRLLDLASISDFKWDADALERIRIRIENAKCRMSAFSEAAAWDGSEEEEEDSGDSEDEDEGSSDDWDEDEDEGKKKPAVPGVVTLRTENPLNDLFWIGIADLPLELQKPHILMGDGWLEVGLKPKQSYDFKTEEEAERHAGIPKMDAVKRLAQKMVDERFEKFPDADIHLMTFEDVTHYSKPKNRMDLIAQIQECTAYGGNTRIARAVSDAIKLCKKNPSPVQSHHIVLVTDGMDSDLYELKAQQTEMKRLNIILDVIHVSAPHESFGGGRGGIILKEVCEGTGGKFTKVTRTGDFETRFIEASRRLCLPAPAGA